MNERIALRRTRNRRRSSGGYTLIELMVVVLLIAVLAMMGAPSFVQARSDRLAFSYARTAGELIHNSRARASARGAAQLVLFTTDASFANPRGAVITFEALDGTSAASTPAGPNPVSSCKTPNQWADVIAWAPGAAPTNNVGLVDGLNINDSVTGSINTTERITMTGTDATGGALTTFVLCTTPNGTTYYGSGNSVSNAITAMMAATPFTNLVMINVARHNADGTVAGLNRRVIITGGSAPRIQSQ